MISFFLIYLCFVINYLHKIYNTDGTEINLALYVVRVFDGLENLEIIYLGQAIAMEKLEHYYGIFHCFPHKAEQRKVLHMWQ